MGRLYRFEEGLPPVLTTLNENQRVVDEYGNVYEVSIEDGGAERVVALIVPASAIFSLEDWKDPNTGEKDETKNFMSSLNAEFIRESGTFKIMNGLVKNYLKTNGKITY